MAGSSLTDYLRAVPKAELHVHLEGSIQPATLLTLAERNGVELPVRSAAETADWFRFRDFDHFVEVYWTITGCLRTADDYELIVYELTRELAGQNVRYAEVTFSPSTHRFLCGIPHETYFAGLTRGRQRGRADFGVEIRWVFDIVRNLEDAARNRVAADYTCAVAIEGRQEGVVALGLGGAEVGYPPERFAPWFDRGLAAGLHSVPHAGETVGPGSVWGALDALGAERLGHGVRSAEDPALVAHLAERGIPLEVCPTSNLALGVYRNLDEHPLARLHWAGVPVTVNSDDPPLFGTTLNDEVALLATAFDLDLETIDQILLNGVRHSFLPADRKRQMEAAFRSEMAALRRDL